MRRLSDWIAALAVVTGCAVGLALLPRIPVYRALVVSVLPATAVVVYVILRGLGRRSVSGRRQEPLIAIAVNAVLFIMGLHVLMVSNLAGAAWARALGPRSVIVLLGGAIVVAGNLLPRIPPNLAIGIRTRQTLEDPRVWSRIHRFSGYVAVALGCVIGLAGVFVSGQAIGPVVALSAIVAVASVSVAYRRLTHLS